MNSQEFCSLQEAYLDVYASPEQLDEISMMHVQLAATPRPAEVRKAPAKKPSPIDFAPAAATAATGGAAIAAMARDGRKRKKEEPPIRSVYEESDIYDIILSHLLDEGYADTEQSAIAIMSNMSEEWREDIVEAYVDYRKGKLPSGRTPQQAAQGREKLLNARAAAKLHPAGVNPDIRNRNRRENQSKRTQEMDSHTGLAARAGKQLWARGMKNEPNTERHHKAMQNRKIASNLRSAERG